MNSVILKNTDINLTIITKSLILCSLFALVVGAYSAVQIINQGFTFLYLIPILFVVVSLILNFCPKVFHGIPSATFIITLLTSYMIFGVIEFGFISGVIALILFCCLFLELLSSKRVAVSYIIVISLIVSWFGIITKEEAIAVNQFQFYVIQYNGWLYSLSSVVLSFLLLAIIIIEYHAAYQNTQKHT